MTTQEIRIIIMKNHITLTSLSKRIGCAPVQLDQWLSDDALSDDIKDRILKGIEVLMKTWKLGIAAEKTKNGMLIKPYMLENYRKKKEQSECQ